MTKIDFNEPSKGDVNSADAALEINQTGSGFALLGKGNSTAIYVEAGDIFGDSGTAISAHGHGKDGGIGVDGHSDHGTGIKGTSLHGVGVSGTGEPAGISGVSGSEPPARGDDVGVGVYGLSDWSTGVFGKSDRGKVGVHGECSHVDGAGVEGINTSTTRGIGVLGRGKTAGRFEGSVEVTGDISLLNADCAEDFDVLDGKVEPGTVMVLTEDSSLQQSYQEYDKKVAGIISGAGGYKPAMILDRQNSVDQNGKDRMPIALMGKVYCRVDARHSSIEIGDLLTTSSTRGYAMKAQDPVKAFGAVIGKALDSIKEGLGMIPVLVTLQ